jgi:pyrroline-5-carboxylate reductase
MTRFLFIGGGNMAQAVIGGLCQAGTSADAIHVVEPADATRQLLAERFGVAASEAPTEAGSAAAQVVVWAVKPQTYPAAAASLGGRLAKALHLSVMAGIRSDALARDTGSERVVRAMPNTPALIGRGIAGLYARPAVDAADRALVSRVLAATGAVVWVGEEDQLDAVTALSGSGPAYVFYFAEALVAAGVRMGLDAAAARQLVLATFSGAAALAEARAEPLAVLREQVTSKGGTTFAALESMRADAVAEAISRAAEAAGRRAAELGRAAA